MSSTTGTLEIHDTRTLKKYSIPVTDNVILGSDLAEITAGAGSANDKISKPDRLRVLDPGYANTAVMESSVTYCGDNEDGTAAHLEFRGHSFDSLRRTHDFEEVTYLMIWGKTPTAAEKQWLRKELYQACTDIPDSVFEVVRSFPQDSPYYSMLLGGLSAFLATKKDFIPAMSARNIYHGNEKALDRGCIQTIAAYYSVLAAVYCHRNGRAFVRNVAADKPLMVSLFMMMGLIEDDTSSKSKTMLYAMDKIWIAGVDHEMNNSNAALLHAASTLADPVSCFMSALGSSYGVLHFGAVESVYTFLKRIKTPDNVAVAIAACKATKQRIMGVGHRVYKSRDPRIEPMKGLLHSLAEEGMKDPLLDVAYEVERQIHSDKHFIDRKLCVNIDLFWPLSYTAMGINPDAMLPIFLCSRIVGMMAHWRESMLKPIKLWRPLVVFTGTRAPEDNYEQEIAPVPVYKTQKPSLMMKLAISALNRPGMSKILSMII